MADEVERYKAKGDFGAYNEPSWVPPGYCKCCAMTPGPNGEVRKSHLSLVKLVEIETTTEKKNLSVLLCPNCDHRN